MERFVVLPSKLLLRLENARVAPRRRAGFPHCPCGGARGGEACGGSTTRASIPNDKYKNPEVERISSFTGPCYLPYISHTLSTLGWLQASIIPTLSFGAIIGGYRASDIRRRKIPQLSCEGPCRGFAAASMAPVGAFYMGTLGPEYVICWYLDPLGKNKHPEV